MEPLVSAVITTYNRQRDYLCQAIDSVRAQTYTNIEILLVDDNGRGTPNQLENEAFLKQYPEICYLVNEKNSGAQFSRNRGISASHGEYIAFLDDDDFWTPGKIARQVEYFEKYPEAGLIFCEGTIFEDGDPEHGIPYQAHPVFDEPIRSDRMLYMDFVGSTSQVLIKRECFDTVGLFDPEMPARQDYEMWIRISRKYPLVGCPEPMFYHRMHKGDQISTNSSRLLAGYTNIYLKYKKDYKNNPRARTKILLVLCSKNAEQRNYGKAIVYFFRGCLSHPAEAVKQIRERIRKDRQR